MRESIFWQGCRSWGGKVGKGALSSDAQRLWKKPRNRLEDSETEIVRGPNIHYKKLDQHISVQLTQVPPFLCVHKGTYAYYLRKILALIPKLRRIAVEPRSFVPHLKKNKLWRETNNGKCKKKNNVRVSALISAIFLKASIDLYLTCMKQLLNSLFIAAGSLYTLPKYIPCLAL